MSECASEQPASSAAAAAAVAAVDEQTNMLSTAKIEHTFSSLLSLPRAVLQRMCVEANVSKNGVKLDLVTRLLKPERHQREVKAKAKPKAKAEPEAKAVAKAEVKASANGEAKAEPKAEAKAEPKANAEARGSGRMTTERVDALFTAVGVDAAQCNPCLKQGVLAGHVPLTAEGGIDLDWVLLKGACEVCEKAVSCTVRDAVKQATRGHDYGEFGAVHCEDKDSGEYCSGMYISNLCKGRFSLGDGRRHNHCTLCPDFGTCLGSLTEGHCERCGGHYYRGSQSFPCPQCGDGDSVTIDGMPGMHMSRQQAASIQSMFASSAMAHQWAQASSDSDSYF